MSLKNPRDPVSRGGTAVMAREHAVRARGGVSGGAILTGVVVAFGCMFLLTALIGGILAALGVIDPDVAQSEAVDAGIAAGVALVVAQFLSHLWGGYTAGRMSRGAGFANGLLVPIVAILVAVLVGGVAAALGATANLNLPFSTNRLPLENDTLVDWGVGIGIASVVAMFLGGVLGGSFGSRWHTKLERRAYEEEIAEAPASAPPHTAGRDDTIDVRDDTSARHPTTPIKR